MERRGIGWQRVALAAAFSTAAHVAGAQGAPGTSPTVPGTITPALQRPGDSAPATVFSADVVIDESVVDDTGALVETRPQTRYRMSVRRAGHGLQTEIVYPAARLFPKGPLADPRSGHRIVFGGDLASGRIYDATGALVSGSPEATAPGDDPGLGPESGLVLADRHAKGRRSELVRRFGPALGRVAGRDRYLASDGDVLTETLVEPATMLPVEINVARDGALAHRTSIAYGRMPGRRWYVARMRTETALRGDAGRRFVSSRTHLNVVSEEGR